MKLQLKALSLALGASTLMFGTAWGASEVATGAGPVVANAALNFTLTVPKVIALRVGRATAADTIAIGTTINTGVNTWGTDAAAPTAASLFGAPTYVGTATPAASGDMLNKVQAYAWTNVAAGGTLTCAAPVGTINPADLSVASVGVLGHPTPGPLSAACPSAGTAIAALGAVKTAAWTYTFIGDFTTYNAGGFTSAVTYTATAP